MSYIKKEDALAVIMSVWKDADYDAHPLSETYDRIARLPVFAPYQKKGNWIKETDRKNHWHCNCCNWVTSTEYYFCPTCGAEMADVPDVEDGKTATAEFWTEVEREAQYLLWYSRKEAELLKREDAKG